MVDVVIGDAEDEFSKRFSFSGTDNVAQTRFVKRTDVLQKVFVGTLQQTQIFLPGSLRRLRQLRKVVRLARKPLTVVKSFETANHYMFPESAVQRQLPDVMPLGSGSPECLLETQVSQ